MKYPVITLWQPWAQWVALGWKTIETRTHNRLSSLLGRDILIHAGLKWDENAVDEALDYLSCPRITQTMNQDGEYHPVRSVVAAGHIIAKAHVWEHIRLKPGHARDALIECHTERYGTILGEITLLKKFIPAQGKQGIWYYEGKVS